MTDPKKPTEESARERASQKDIAEVERAVVRGRRGPNTKRSSGRAAAGRIPPQQAGATRLTRRVVTMNRLAGWLIAGATGWLALKSLRAEGERLSRGGNRGERRQAPARPFRDARRIGA